MDSFEDKLKVFAAAQKLNWELRYSQKNLMEELSLSIDRQMTHYYDNVKKKIMSDFEKEIDDLIKESKAVMKINLDSDGRLFTLSGTLPTL